jgi:hypothetical protein
MKRRNEAPCIRCGLLVLWQDQKRYYGRIIRSGYTPEEAKAIGRVCTHCCKRITKAKRKEVRGQA